MLDDQCCQEGVRNVSLRRCSPSTKRPALFLVIPMPSSYFTKYKPRKPEIRRTAVYKILGLLAISTSINNCCTGFLVFERKV